MHVSHAERSHSAHNQGDSVACLATWQPYLKIRDVGP